MPILYKTPARLATSHDCRELLRRCAEDVTVYRDVPAVMHMQVEQAFIDFCGPKRRYRPRLVLQGKPLKFVGEFPGNFTECRMLRDTDKPILSYSYEFTRQNLAELASKGLFEQGFQVPNIIRHNVMELPCLCNFITVQAPPAQDFEEPEPTLVFIRVQDGSKDGERDSLVCFDVDHEVDGRVVPGSGYVISEYFEHMPEAGYVMNEEPEAMDSLEDEISDQLSVQKTLQQDSEPVFDRSDDIGFDRESELIGEDEHPVSHEVESEVPEVLSPEEQAHAELFEKIRREANEAYEERERQKQRVAQQAAASVEHVADMDVDDEIGDTLSDESEQDKERHDPNKLDRMHDINKAQNIETRKELLEEGDGLSPADMTHVDLKEPVHEPSKRELPDISGIQGYEDDDLIPEKE